MELSKRRIITDSQLNLMLDFLEAHPDLAMGSNRGRDIRAVSKKLWLECAEILNAEGPTRTGKAWSKVWLDYKHRVRAKLALSNAGSSQGSMLSPLEKRLSDTFFAKELDSLANSGHADPDSGKDSMTFESNEETEEQNRRRSVTIPQWELMMDFLESHLDLAVGRTRKKEDSAVAKKLWIECAEILNAKGPPRTAKEWAKVWNIYKHRVRSKLVLGNTDPERGGCMLSPLEERVRNTFIGKEVDPLADSGNADHGSDSTIFESNEEAGFRTEKRYKCVTVRQMELMLDFLESHPDVGRGRTRTKEGRHDARMLWNGCAEGLNAEGPSRTGREWSKVWNDYKARLKGKLATLQRNGLRDRSGLSPLEERMISFISVKVEPLPLASNEHSYSRTCAQNEEKKNRSVRKVTTVRQLKLMLDFLEPHRDVALGHNRSRACRADAVKLWRECAKILNAEGPQRTPRQWSKVWNDYKAQVRSKLAHRNACIRRDGPSQAPKLTPLEMRVIHTYIVNKVNPLANNLQEISYPDCMTFESNKDQTTTMSMNEAEFQSTLEVSQATSSPTPSESYEIAYPVPSESYEIAYPVPSESYEIAYPVPSESYEIAYPVPSESYEIAYPVPSESHETASPVRSEYHAIASPVPSEEIASPVPSEWHGTASPVPSESHGIAFPVKSEPYEIASPVPSELHGIASLVPSVSGQFPSPSSGPGRVMRVRKRRRRAARPSQRSSKAAEEARMILLEIENNRTEMDLRNAHTISGALEYLKSIATSLDRLTNMYSHRDQIGATGVTGTGGTESGGSGTRITGAGSSETGAAGTGSTGTVVTGVGGAGTGAMGT